tara:strand:- start:185 stop:934 length:750 start_codon:yes stop_codon:yes gene_type:complete
MTNIPIHRGRVVQYGTTAFERYDRGKTDSCGDTEWTKYKGVGPVTVRGIIGDTLLTLDGVYTHVYGYRLTWSQYVGAEQVVLVGDFTFLARTGWLMYSAGTYLLLNNGDGELKHTDILDLERPVSVDLDIGLKPSLNKEEHIHLSASHLSPCVSGDLPADTVYEEWSDDKYSAFLESQPKLHVCQGAVRVSSKEHGVTERWLFPHPEGARAAWEHLQNTTREDDWTRLQTMLNDAHPIEKERVLVSFTK